MQTQTQTLQTQQNESNNILELMKNYLPSELITLILSYNGYYDRKGIYMKKIDLTEYKKIVDMLSHRKECSFGNGFYIPIFSKDCQININKIHYDMKFIVVNYNYRPMHHPDYQMIDEMSYNHHVLNPFDFRCDDDNDLDLNEKTVFCNIITYDTRRVLRSIEDYYNMEMMTIVNIVNAEIYIPYEKLKFYYHPDYPYEVLEIDDDLDFNRYYYADQENYDRWEEEDYDF